MGGQVIDGKWCQRNFFYLGDSTGKFKRAHVAFHHEIKADKTSEFLAEPDRYHLYISYACPWASRTLIMRKLRGLENIISCSPVDPFLGDVGWSFGLTQGEDTEDKINGFRLLYQAYLASAPKYTGRITVPVLWDKKTHTIVNNDSAMIVRMLNSEFNEFAGNQQDYCPQELIAEIDKIDDYVYQHINNGVYKCGFATTQEAYNDAFDQLFVGLDFVDDLLSHQRYLVQGQLTEADWRLFCTLIRFDVVYFGHFKCNKRRIADYPNLSNYLRELYQFPGIAETVNFDHIKSHYYQSHKQLNPTGVVPKGPEMDLLAPHNRDNVPLTRK